MIKPTSIVALMTLLTLPCCKDEQEETSNQGAAPPPIESSRPGACASGGGKVDDAVTSELFPRTVSDWCIDPNGETRAYGEQAPGTVDQVCTELFDGECEVYKAHGLQRVVTLRYIDGGGSPASVSVNLSRFKDPEGAYAFFTKRVVGDDDPATLTTKPLDAGGAGALGSGIAYVWKGKHVAELSYANELEAPAQLKASAARILPSIGKAIGSKLPGDAEPPAAVRALPDAHRLPLGVKYTVDDVMGVQGVGTGAVGFYQEGDKRWRAFVVVRPDEASAKDVMGTLSKLDGSEKLKAPPIDGLKLARAASEQGPQVEWVVTRSDKKVLGVGDEEETLDPSAAPGTRSEAQLSFDQKIDKVKALR